MINIVIRIIKPKLMLKKGYMFETNDTSNQAMSLEYMIKEN